MFLAVFDRDFKDLMFCSGVPTCSLEDMCETRRGIAVVSRTHAREIGGGKFAEGTGAFMAPVVNALQPGFGGGQFDAHIMLIEKPETASGRRR